VNDGVDRALVAVRFFAFVLALGSFGGSAFELYAPGSEPAGRRPLAIAAAGLLVLAALAYAALLAREATGAPGLPDPAALFAIWRTTGFGRALAVAALAAAALAVLLAAAPRLRWARIVLAAVALAAFAFVGHGADDEGLRRDARIVLLAAHLIAVAAWIGALPALWRALGRRSEPVKLVRRFGLVGLVSVGAMLITGAAMVAFIAAGARGGLGRAYVMTLAVKLGFVAGLLSLAAINRLRLTPLLSRDPQRARRMLRSTIVAEQALGLGALVSVALLGQLDPAM
jgi:putative copper resistance protein D